MRSETNLGRLDKIHNEQISALYNRATKAALISGLGMILAVFAFWQLIPKAHTLAWAGLLTISLLLRLLVVKMYKHRAQYTTKINWGARLAVSQGLSGLSWGIGSIIFFLPDAIDYQMWVAISVCTLLGGAMVHSSFYLPAFYAFLFPTVTPLIGRFLYEQTTVHSLTALIVAVFVGALIIFSRDLQKQLVTSISLRLDLEREKHEAEKLRSEAVAADRSKSKFLASASHDLRQPLHALGLFVDELAYENRSLPSSSIGNIQIALSDLNEMFDGLLNLSQIESGTLQTNIEHFKLNPIFEKLEQNFHKQAREKKLTLNIIPTRIVLQSDRKIIERILRNLISNAIRYTQNGGIVVGCRRKGQWVQVQVVDTGIGINKDKMDRIFNEFYQLDNPHRDRRQGVGLGLAIVKGLTKRLNVELRVASKIGRGSTFSVTIAKGNPSKIITHATSDVYQPFNLLGNLNILVIDDDPLILSGMKKLLNNWGCHVHLSESGVQAIEFVTNVDVPIELVISDLWLPNNESGFDVLDSIAHLSSDYFSGIIITGDTDEKNTLFAQQKGYPLLHKPVRASKLRAVLNSIARQRPDASGQFTVQNNLNVNKKKNDENTSR